MNHDEYLSHDATALAQLVRSGDVSALELLELAIERAEALNPAINAIVRPMYEEARLAATRPTTGPFTGVPFLAKDLVSNYAGHPTSAGSRYLADHVMPNDSELASRVRASGVSVFGKTNLPEWGLLPVSESIQWGACRNPYDTDLTPGGSSGGAGAAVAAGIVPMAGGGDGGGSIRIPASCCGLFGLKPTRGRTPTGPDNGMLWRGATVEHVLTRSVRDSVRMLDATHGPDAGAPFEIPVPHGPYEAELAREAGRLRIAWTTKPIVDTPVHADCVAAVEDAASLLGELGHDLVEATPDINGDDFAKAFLTVIAGELSADMEAWSKVLGRRPLQSELEPSTYALMLVGRALSAEGFASGMRFVEQMGRTVGRFFEDYDLLLTPTLASPPVRIGTIGSTPMENRLMRVLGFFGSGRLIKAAGLIEQAADKALDFIPWTPVFNATGQPAMSVPLFWSEVGLPIGVHIVGRFADEATLFRVASQLEEARPWFGRLPSMARSLG